MPPGCADLNCRSLQVGENPASQVYVRNNQKSCEEVAFRSISHDLPDSTTQEALLAVIDRLNDDVSVDDILVQLPLPPRIDEEAVIERILPTKGVDGLHPYNVGRLALRTPVLRPCTPKGVMTLSQRTETRISWWLPSAGLSLYPKIGSKRARCV